MAYVGAEVGVSILAVLSQAERSAEPAGAYKSAPATQAVGTVLATRQYEFTGQSSYLSSAPQVYAKPPVVSTTLLLLEVQATPALVQSLARVDPTGDSSLLVQATAKPLPRQYELAGQIVHTVLRQY